MMTLAGPICSRAQFTSPHWGEVGAERRVRVAALTREHNPSPGLLRNPTSPYGRGESPLRRSIFQMVAVLAVALALPCTAAAQALASYQIVGDGIPESLTGAAGDAARGRALVLERTSTCILCHSG